MDVLTTTKFWDSEISKSVDFNYGAMSSINTLHALYQGLFAEAVNSFVLSGMTIVQATPPSMNVAIKPGLLFSRIENKLLHLGNDLVVSVEPADLAADRIDTLEVKYCVQDIDVASRAFKDPITGTVTYSDVETKTQAYIEARVVPGVPGSGVAPDTEAGWTKLAEVVVPAGATQIITTNIKPVTAIADGEETTAWTAEKSFTFLLTSVSAIKTMILAHIRNNITDQNTVHGIRQGSGNGFDADKVDGIEGVDIVKRLTKSTGSVSDCVLNSWTICSSNVTGLPTTGAYYNVLTVGDATNSQQLAIHLSSRGYIYTRLKDSGTWGDWCVLWSSQNDGAGSGLDADLLDGRQASSFVYDNPEAILSGSVIDAFTHSGMYLSTGDATDTPVPGSFCYFVNRYDSNSGVIKAVNYVTGQEWTGWIVGGEFKGWLRTQQTDRYGASIDISGQDIHTLRPTGCYMGANVVNAPDAGWWYYDIKNYGPIGGGYFVIDAISIGQHGLHFRKTIVGGTPSGWTPVWNGVNDGYGSGLVAEDSGKVGGRGVSEILTRQASGASIDISGEDIHTLRATGCYMGANVVNAPDAGWWYFDIKYHGGTGYEVIDAISLAYHGRHFRKTIISGLSADWTPVWNGVNDGYGSGLVAEDSGKVGGRGVSEILTRQASGASIDISGEDIHTLRATGQYLGLGVANAPDAGWWYYDIKNYGPIGGGYFVIDAISIGQHGLHFRKTIVGGTPSGWTPVWNGVNVGSGWATALAAPLNSGWATALGASKYSLGTRDIYSRSPIIAPATFTIPEGEYWCRVDLAPASGVSLQINSGQSWIHVDSSYTGASSAFLYCGIIRSDGTNLRLDVYSGSVAVRLIRIG